MALANDSIVREIAIEQKRTNSPEILLDNLSTLRDRLGRAINELEETLEPFTIPPDTNDGDKPATEFPQASEYWRDALHRVSTIDYMVTVLFRIISRLDL